MLIAVGKGRRNPGHRRHLGPALLRAADAGADVLKPNAAELVDATGITDPVEGARSLIARGVGLVLLSLGADGMLAVTASDLVHARDSTNLLPATRPVPEMPGVAACAVLYAEGERDPEQILRRATAWSACRRCSPPLAGDISPRWRELEQQLRVSHPDPESFRKDPS